MPAQKIKFYRELLEGNHLPVALDQLPSQSQVAGPSQLYVCWLVINVLLIKQVQCLGDHFWAVVSHKRWPISSNSFGAISEECWRPISLVSACFYQYIVLFITFIGPGGFRLIKFMPQGMPNSGCIKGVTAVHGCCVVLLILYLYSMPLVSEIRWHKRTYIPTFLGIVFSIILYDNPSFDLYLCCTRWNKSLYNCKILRMVTEMV